MSAESVKFLKTEEQLKYRLYFTSNSVGVL